MREPGSLFVYWAVKTTTTCRLAACRTGETRSHGQLLIILLVKHGDILKNRPTSNKETERLYFFEVLTSVILYKSTKARRNLWDWSKGRTYLHCANGNHGNTMWRDGVQWTNLTAGVTQKWAGWTSSEFEELKRLSLIRVRFYWWYPASTGFQIHNIESNGMAAIKKRRKRLLYFPLFVIKQLHAFPWSRSQGAERNDNHFMTSER